MPNTYDIGDSIELLGYFTSFNTVGQIDAGSTILTVQDATGYAASDAIIVSGAGDLGSDLITTVSGSPVGNVITLAAPAKTSVVRGKTAKLITPTTITLKVRAPDGTTTTISTTALGVGRYTGSFIAAMAGQHWYRFEGTGTAAVDEEQTFFVRQRRVA